MVSYHAVQGEPAMPPGSRWIIVIYTIDQAALASGQLNGQYDEAWAVAADGAISVPPLVTAPSTLTAFLAWFDLPATDTESPVARSGPSSLVLLLAAFGGAFVAIKASSRRRALRDQSPMA